MHLSYAQNLEDYHLDLLFRDVALGTYIDVGGGHPVADNVSFHAYLRGWRGLIVEPQEDLARLYAGVRPRDEVVSCLAGRTSGHIDFHVVEGFHGLSSAVAANAERARGYGAATRVIKKSVEPLSALIDAARLGEIHFLKIDVEGAEPDVIAGLDLHGIGHKLSLSRRSIRTISRPMFRPGSRPCSVPDTRTLFFDNLNRFYVATEAAHLASRLPSAPTPWDKVAHLWDHGRVADRPDHPDRRLADVLIAGLMANLPRAAAQQPAMLAQLVGRGLATLDKAGQTPASLMALFGTAEQPDGSLPPVETLDDLIATDAFRAALGRIACMYDGGHLME